MSRKGMDVKQLNVIMKRCKDVFKVRYVSPTIHPSVVIVVAFIIHTSDESIELTITNNPDENFNLFDAVNKVLDKLEGRRNEDSKSIG